MLALIWAELMAVSLPMSRSLNCAASSSCNLLQHYTTLHGTRLSYLDRSVMNSDKKNVLTPEAPLLGRPPRARCWLFAACNGRAPLVWALGFSLGFCGVGGSRSGCSTDIWMFGGICGLIKPGLCFRGRFEDLLLSSSIPKTHCTLTLHWMLRCSNVPADL